MKITTTIKFEHPVLENHGSYRVYVEGLIGLIGDGEMYSGAFALKYRPDGSIDEVESTALGLRDASWIQVAGILNHLRSVVQQ